MEESVQTRVSLHCRYCKETPATLYRCIYDGTAIILCKPCLHEQAYIAELKGKTFGVQIKIEVEKVHQNIKAKVLANLTTLDQLETNFTKNKE